MLLIYKIPTRVLKHSPSKARVIFTTLPLKWANNNGPCEDEGQHSLPSSHYRGLRKHIPSLEAATTTYYPQYNMKVAYNHNILSAALLHDDPQYLVEGVY